MKPKAKRPPGPSGRDLGLSAPGAGKGDTSRITDAKAFRENFDEILGLIGDNHDFKKHGNKLIKTYK